MSDIKAEDIEELGRNLDNWASVDSYGVYVIGYAWREKILHTERIKKYLKAKDVWQKRIAFVATVSLNLKSQGGW